MDGSSEPEPELELLTDGYPKLATLIGRTGEVAIFKRFSALNAENLLFMQAELLYLENELKKIVDSDLRADSATQLNAAPAGIAQPDGYQNEASHEYATEPDRKLYARSWRIMWEDARRYPLNSRQWQMRMLIKEKLKEYSTLFPLLILGRLLNNPDTDSLPDDAIIQASQMRQLDKPDKYDVQLVRNWTFLSDGGDGFPDLETPGEKLPWGTLEEPNDDDLLCLKGRGDQDAFTRWLAGTFLDSFNDWLQKKKFWQNYLEKADKQKRPSDAFFRPRVFDKKTGLVDWSETKILKMADNISTAIASLFPVVSTIALYYIQSTVARLLVLAGFLVLFALSLSLFTNARRIEVFGATAA
ncbi:MAG: hypothetical protein MMC33_001495 [Icmadophila ericetorum]|nr:hypothetical protein [Icmadophila ericetorum]